MEAWVYHKASRHEEASRFIAELRAAREYGPVIPANVRHYQGEVHRGAVVFHDGSRRDLVWANERAGVKCVQFTGEDDYVPAPVVPGPAVEPTATAQLEVRQAGQWFTAYRDGEKVGKAQRSEEAAWDLLGGRP